MVPVMKTTAKTTQKGVGVTTNRSERKMNCMPFGSRILELFTRSADTQQGSQHRANQAQ
jgi:hypothetical protein